MPKLTVLCWVVSLESMSYICPGKTVWTKKFVSMCLGICIYPNNIYTIYICIYIYNIYISRTKEREVMNLRESREENESRKYNNYIISTNVKL